jgi:hypothetical protein
MDRLLWPFRWPSRSKQSSLWPPKVHIQLMSTARRRVRRGDVHVNIGVPAMLRHPRRVRGFQKAGFAKRIRVGGEIRGVALFGTSSAEILCSFNGHVFNLQILLCPCGDRPLAVVHAVRIGFLGSLSSGRSFARALGAITSVVGHDCGSLQMPTKLLFKRLSVSWTSPSTKELSPLTRRQSLPGVTEHVRSIAIACSHRELADTTSSRRAPRCSSNCETSFTKKNP